MARTKTGGRLKTIQEPRVIALRVEASVKKHFQVCADMRGISLGSYVRKVLNCIYAAETVGLCAQKKDEKEMKKTQRLLPRLEGTLTPTHGRDYKTKKAVLAAFEAEENFFWNQRGQKTLTCRRLILKYYGERCVTIRYNGLKSVLWADIKRS